MSLTSSYFSKMKITASGPARIKGRKACRCLKKCGNCIHALLTKTYPNDGLYNEYYCEEKKCKVLNHEVGCSCFDNRWKSKIKPQGSRIRRSKKSVKLQGKS